MDIESIKNYLYERDEIIFAYLYGSFAKETNNKLSDIDIAIYIDENEKPPSSYFGYRSDLISEIQKYNKKEIDLVILNDVSISIAYNVFKEGKLLFTKSKKIKTNFHEKIINKYLDFLPLFEVQEKYLKNSIKKGTFGR